MRGVGKTFAISMCLIFLRCHALCVVLIVLLASENSGRMEWQSAVLNAGPAQKMKSPIKQVSIEAVINPLF